MADDLEPWLKWTYYISPLSYGQNAIVMNEFLDKRWSNVSFLFYIISFNDHELSLIRLFFLVQPNTDPRFNESTVGEVLLHSRGFFTEERWFWICCFALLAFSVLFNILFIVALTFLKRKSCSVDSIATTLCWEREFECTLANVFSSRRFQRFNTE